MGEHTDRADLLAAIEEWARFQDSGLGRYQTDTAAARVRLLAGCPVGCYAGEDLPDGRDPGDDPEDLEAAHYVGIELAYEVPSLNALMRMHHRVRTRERNALAAQVLAQVAGRHGRPEPRPVPRRVHYRCYRRQRIKDEDNLVGGTKMIQDVLAQVGLVWADERYWLLPSYEQHTAGRTMPRTEIEIWDYPEESWSDEQRRMIDRAEMSDKDRRAQMTAQGIAGRKKVRGWDPEACASRREESRRSARRYRKKKSNKRSKT